MGKGFEASSSFLLGQGTAGGGAGGGEFDFCVSGDLRWYWGRIPIGSGAGC